MARCLRCNNEFSGIAAFSFNKTTNRCKQCDAETKQALEGFRTAFLQFTRDNHFTFEEWNTLSNGAITNRINLIEALNYIRSDTQSFIERKLSFAAADGLISDQEEQEITRLTSILALPPPQAQPLLQRMSYIKNIGNKAFSYTIFSPHFYFAKGVIYPRISAFGRSTIIYFRHLREL